MKLYAAITSERGKPVDKSGNEYINVSIKDENRETISELVLQRSTDGLGDIIYYRTWFADRLYPWNEKKHKKEDGIQCPLCDKFVPYFKDNNPDKHEWICQHCPFVGMEKY